MGLVTDYLRNTIIRQVADHGVVVWYDPDRHYAAVADTLNISNTAVARYENSFFALRRQIEPLLENNDPPRLVVYVPLDQADTHNALVELETAGVVLKPGQQPPTRNTRLAVLARNALKAILSEEKVADIEKQVEAGKLTLAELDDIADKGGDVAGVVSVIFNTTHPQEVALCFLTNPAFDADIVQKNAGNELATLLRNAFEVDLPPDGAPEMFREQLARHILATDFMVGFQGKLPSALSRVKIAAKPAARTACLHLAQTWRLRRDLRESYLEQAGAVATSLKLDHLDLELNQIRQSQTFLTIEQQLQRQVAATLLSRATPELIELAQIRQAKFWAEAKPDLQAEWALIAVAGQVLLEAERIEQELKQTPTLDATALFERYTGSDRGHVSLPASSFSPQPSSLPWCLLDTYHRHMERRCHHFDFDLAGGHTDLEKLIAKARDRYMLVGANLAKTFLEQYQQAHFHLGGVSLQRETYEQYLKPRLAQGKIAYVWVDALRFEMARDLAQTLCDEFNVEIQTALGTVPTITPIGMAALLPDAHAASTSISVVGGKLALNLKGTIVKDRKSRLDYLAGHAGVEVFDCKLEDLVPKPNKKTQQGIAGANLILVTSQEIDQLCEGDNIPLARRTMDEILHELRRVLRILAELGLQTIILTADHGYLFGEEPGEEMKITAPGGNTVELHRRVWLGQGGEYHPACLRTNLANFGLSSELELVTPWNFAIFKAPGGARAYFHGGLSPQELIIPLLTITPRQQAPRPGWPGEITWNLQLGGSSNKLGRSCSIHLTGQATGLFELEPPKVRVELRTQTGQVISTPGIASYGFEEATGNTQLELKEDDPRAILPNAIAVWITDNTPRQDVTLYLLDAASGVELARLEGLEVVGGIE